MIVDNLTPGSSSSFSKSSLYVWKFSVHILLKPNLKDFEHYFASMWHCTVIGTLFGIALLWYWNENWPFPALWPLLTFPNLLAYSVQHFNMFESESRSVVSDSLQPHGLYNLWNSPGQNTGVGSLSLLQGIIPTQGSNPGLPHCRQVLFQLSYQGNPKYVYY